MAHLSREEMEAFCAGTLTLEEEGRVVIHLLLDRCPECLAAAPPRLPAVMLENVPPGPPTPEEEAACAAAVDRACAWFLEEHRRLLELQPQAERALQALRAGRKRPKGVQDLAWLRALLDRSWELRFDDPQEMEFLASLAVQLSLRLDPGACGGRKRVLDHQAEALACLGNAHRVAEQFREAKQALAHARRLFEQGTRADHLEVRLLDFEASLLGNLHELVPATAKLKQVLQFHIRNGDLHLAGRTLVTMGHYAGLAGNHETAIRRARQSLRMIEEQRDPVLAFGAAKNLILFLVEAGRIAEAKKARLRYSRQLRSPGGRIGEIKLRSIDGRMEAALGRYRRAETIFRKAIADFAQVGLPINAGIEMLQLTAVLLRQGKAGEATGTVLEASAIFIPHRLPQEALQAVILLRDAFRMGAGTLEMVEEVTAFLRRLLESGAESRFEAQAWAEPPDGGSTD